MLDTTDGPPPWARKVYELGLALVKEGEATPSYGLAGMLQMSRGRLVVVVPNGLAHAVLGALREPGVELPPAPEGERFNACVEVMSPAEVESLGGPDRVSERGKQYHYSIGRLYEADADWPGVSKLWYLRVHSPELQELRRSYGLASLPGDDFHVVVAVRRRGVLGRNDKSKA
jgi:hypothetical protein